MLDFFDYYHVLIQQGLVAGWGWVVRRDFLCNAQPVANTHKNEFIELNFAINPTPRITPLTSKVQILFKRFKIQPFPISMAAEIHPLTSLY